MNLTRLKTYAPAARAALITAVTRRAAVLGIQPGRVEEVTESGGVALIGGQPFPRSIVPLRKQLLDLIHRDGFDHTMEAMAYTWFNRLVALRFMELHDGYLDHGYRVLSHPQGTPLPEILQHAEYVSLKGLDREEVIRLKLDGNRDEELYRLLLLAQCAELNQILPDVFSKLDDVTILLLPDNLLHSDSVIRQLVAGSDAEDWQQVEVLGWLYQFYISEKKDAVMARKSAVPTEDIPAVTQLFTPHWIVRYLVENSLGRLWLLNRPNSRLRDHMPYYIEGEAETDFLKITKPEEIRLVDPAVGSGHMLTYAFDLLYLIYEEEGYAPGDIPALILRHNLHGLEICPRAAQLAELALVFKAREKSRRFFQPEHLVRPRIIELRDVRFAENELRDYIHALGLGDLFNQPMLRLLHQFEEAKNFGSLIQPCLDERAIADTRRAIEAKDLGGQLFLRETHLKVLRVLEQAEALTQRYHVVVANPPYMGGKQLNDALRDHAKLRFPDSKSDIFAMFIERGFDLVKPSGFSAMVTMQSWMFLSSYEELRQKLLQKHTLQSLLHMGNMVMGIAFGTAAAVWKKGRLAAAKGHYCYVEWDDLTDEGEPSSFPPPNSRNKQFAEPTRRHYEVASTEFQKIPGCPIAYWASQRVIGAFERATMSVAGHVESEGKNVTTDNMRFTRRWWEIALNDLGGSSKRWFPFAMGGAFRKWFGNMTDVVDWAPSALNHYRQSTAGRLIRKEFWYLKGITWGKITSSMASFRLLPVEQTYQEVAILFTPEKEPMLMPLLGLLNSVVSEKMLQFLSPTLNYQLDDICRIPWLNPLDTNVVTKTVQDLVCLACSDWDNFETSWDFRDQPLLRPGLKGATLEASWRNWEAQSTAAIRRMQELETENNRLFIDAYGLDGELEPEVPEEQITLARADARRDMAAFLSYAVGCMMGRYSLDHPGLILANAGDSLREFLEKVGKPLAELTFAPDEDGIIPVLDGEWFEDDIVTRTRDFLRATFGEAMLIENLRFIEESLGKELRTYFLNDFYKEHLQTYKNRPIYWQLSSGKQKAFQCLIYLHRYTPATLARIRTEYAIPLQGKLSARITRLEEEVTQTSSSAARKKLQTDLDKSKKQIVELLTFDEQLRSYADQAITLDLDDGVKSNYAKFGPLVAEAKKICGTKED
jgi:hypothetical protein